MTRDCVRLLARDAADYGPLGPRFVKWTQATLSWWQSDYRVCIESLRQVGGA